jgi:hypothetical protein
MIYNRLTAAVLARPQEFVEFSKALSTKQCASDDAAFRLELHIRDCWDNREEKKSFIIVINSSGNGKTFSCIKLCSSMRALYTLTKKLDRYEPTPEVATFIDVIKTATSLAQKNAIATAFVRILEACLRNANLPQKTIFNYQFENDRSLGITALLRATFPALTGQSFRQYLIQAAKNPTPTKEKKYEQVTSSSSPLEVKRQRKVTFEDSVDGVAAAMESMHVVNAEPVNSDGTFLKPSHKLKKAKLVDELVPCVVFFDEASGLLADTAINTEDCPLRCLQRALNASDIIGVFLGTSSRLEMLEATESSKRSSAETFRESTDPVVNIISHDLFRQHTFFLGRPLWYSWWKHFGNENYAQLVTLAITKLTGASVGNEQQNSMVSCSLFALRFGFEPIAYACSELVANHLAIMLSVGDKIEGRRNSVSCKWLSEPVLSEASACITMQVSGQGMSTHGLQRFRMSEVVDAISYSIINKQIIRPSSGDKGEVVAAALLGYSMDILRASQLRARYSPELTMGNMSSPVKLTAFLSGIGVAVNRLPTAADKYLVNFTHFVRLDCEVSESSCYQAVLRRIGYYVTVGAKSVDIVLVAFRVSDEGGLFCFVPVRILVKNLKSKVSIASAVKLLCAMSPVVGCQPILAMTEMEIGIVIATGTGGVETSTGPVVQPTNQKRSSVQKGVPYFGYLLGLDSEESFHTLRTHGSEGKKVLHSLQSIAHKHATMIEPCFEEGFYTQLEHVSTNYCAY